MKYKYLETDIFYEWLDMPLVDSLEEIMAFDKGMCAMGFKKFIRRMDIHDIPYEDYVIKDNECVLVEEIKEGIRTRISVVGFKMANG